MDKEEKTECIDCGYPNTCDNCHALREENEKLKTELKDAVVLTKDQWEEIKLLMIVTKRSLLVTNAASYGVLLDDNYIEYIKQKADCGVAEWLESRGIKV